MNSLSTLIVFKRFYINLTVDEFDKKTIKDEIKREIISERLGLKRSDKRFENDIHIMCFHIARSFFQDETSLINLIEKYMNTCKEEYNKYRTRLIVNEIMTGNTTINVCAHIISGYVTGYSLNCGY